MKRVALSALVLAMTCLAGACKLADTPTQSTGSSSPIVTDTLPATSASISVSKNTTLTPPPTSNPAPAAGSGLSEEKLACDSFTTDLDRFVFNRLAPVLADGTDLLDSPPDTANRAEVAAGLSEASARLGGLIDELDLMGIPPREVVDLVLSIRRGIELYAAGFQKGSRGWETDDRALIRTAVSETQEAAAVLSSFFGWQLCG